MRAEGTDASAVFGLLDRDETRRSHPVGSSSLCLHHGPAIVTDAKRPAVAQIVPVRPQIVIEEWRIHYNTKRPHSALGYPGYSCIG